MRDLIGYTLYTLIGLGGIVLVFSMFADLHTDSQVERVSSELTLLINGVRKVHRAHPDRFGNGAITDENLIRAGIAPESTVIDADTIQNAFGGDIAVAGVANQTFTVAYEDVPQDVCIRALSSMRPDAFVLGARVAATAAGLATAVREEFPINFATATTRCAADENAISIEAQ